MSRRHDFERWVATNNMANRDFTANDLAASLGVRTREASRLIQAQLTAQTRATSSSRYVLRRQGRTRSTVWHVGHRQTDAAGLCAQEADDMEWRFVRFIQPSLEKIAAANPRAAVAAQTMEAAFTYTFGQLQHMLAANGAAPTP